MLGGGGGNEKVGGWVADGRYLNAEIISKVSQEGQKSAAKSDDESAGPGSGL
jgi:hypothetical protein